MVNYKNNPAKYFMARTLSILTFCTPMVEMFITPTSDIINKYNMVGDNYVEIDSIDEFCECLVVKKGIGGSSLNVFIQLISPAIFIGAKNRNNIIFYEYLKPMLSSTKKLIFEDTEQPTSQCYIVLNNNKRAMATYIKIKPSVAFLKSKINILMLYDIYTISLFMYNINKAAVNYIITLKKYIFVLNLSQVIFVYKKYEDLKSLIEVSDYIIGNKEEFTYLFKLVHKNKELKSDFNFKKIFLDLSINKTLICTNGYKKIKYAYNLIVCTHSPNKIEKQNIVTCGAGDAFLSGVLDEIANRGTVKNLVNRGCERSSTWIITKTDELNKEISKTNHTNFRNRDK